MNFEFMTIDTPLPPCMPFPRALTGFPVSSTAKVMYDEISPDTCRFWDATTGAHLDKDLFRRNMGGEADAYQEVMKRLLG